MKSSDQARTIILATHNKHKITELQAMVGNNINIKGLDGFSPKIAWVETGTTFQENARIKALAVRSHTEAAVLADDSGLSVKALDGAPGIYSSRYGGVDGDDDNNNRKLLKELADIEPEERSAAFICSLVFIDEKGNESSFEGKCEGIISTAASGTQGFGYDPLFVPNGYDKSMAELGEAIKNKISHRFNAVNLWIQEI